MLVSLVLVPIWEAGAGLVKMHIINIITTTMRKMLVSLVEPIWEAGAGLVSLHTRLHSILRRGPLFLEHRLLMYNVQQC